jgi:hypothetical protein
MVQFVVETSGGKQSSIPMFGERVGVETSRQADDRERAQVGAVGEQWVSSIPVYGVITTNDGESPLLQIAPCMLYG